MNQSASASSSPAETSAKLIPPAEPVPAGDEQPTEEGVIFNPRRVTQAFVIVATAICFYMFWVAGQWVGFPVQYKHGGSVLFQSDGILKIVVFWAVLIAGTAVATVLTSWRWFLAGLFCACLGSGAWAVRGGILRNVLFSASSPKIFLVLAAEQVLLLGGVAAMWLVLWQLQQSQPTIAAELAQPKKKDQPAAGDPIFAVATQTLAMGILVLLLAATDSNKQVSASVFIAAACATALAQLLQKKADNLGRWYWIGPLLVGLIGYVGCYLSPHGWDIGLPTGTFAPLARPLPISYASFGMAGALFGYWMTEMVIHVMLATAFFAVAGQPFTALKEKKRVESNA